MISSSPFHFIVHSSNISITKGKPRKCGPIAKWKGDPGNRGHGAGKITESNLCTGPHWQDQPSGISHPKNWGQGALNGDFPLVKEEWVREHPGKHDIYKALMGCIHESWESWQTLQQGYSLSFFKSLRTGIKQMSS